MTFRTILKAMAAGAVGLLMATGPLPVPAGDRNDHAGQQPGGATFALTPGLRALLIEEMRAIRQATGQIVDGLAAGDSAAVAGLAQRIHESFILKQKLSARDEQDLAAAPAAFLRLDAAFHSTAEKLAGAAQRRDHELQRYYFGRLLEGCQECHGRFAADRFPLFGAGELGPHAHAPARDETRPAGHAH